MAGNWIKVEHITPDKPEIVKMAEALGIDQDAVFGKCIRLWIWADQQTIAGDDLIVTPSFLDRLTNCPGFSQQLLVVGWLKNRNGRFSLPHFDRHNGQTAKNRALSADRMQRQRYAQSVTEPSPDLEIEKEKKRRRAATGLNDVGPEHRMPMADPPNIEATKRAIRGFVPPTLEEVSAYCRERGGKVDPAAWMDHYTSNGWKVGPNPMKDWKAACRTWEHRRKNGAPRPEQSSSLQPDFIFPGGAP